MEAIEAGTRLNAKVVGLDGVLGTIEPKMFGDIIIWDGDPLQDITLLQDPSHLKYVIKDGALVDKTGPIGFQELSAEPGRAR